MIRDEIVPYSLPGLPHPLESILEKSKQLTTLSILPSSFHKGIRQVVCGCGCRCVCLLGGMSGSRATNFIPFMGPSGLFVGTSVQTIPGTAQTGSWLGTRLLGADPKLQSNPSLQSVPLQRSRLPVRCQGQTLPTTLPCVWFMRFEGPQWAEIRRGRFWVLSFGITKHQWSRSKDSLLGLTSVSTSVKQINRSQKVLSALKLCYSLICNTLYLTHT